MKSLNLKSIPQHVAIIMDGNGRWAKMRNLPRSEGHRKGVARVREIVREAARLKIKVLTLFAFSTENWKRPKKELGLLMQLLKMLLVKEIKNFNENNIRFECIGRIKEFPTVLLKAIEEAREKTKKNTGMILNLALNYGSRTEIVDAVNKIIHDKISHKLKAGSIDEPMFERYLYSAGLPDPDLLIRTSGEQRISNFLLWQISYSELYFSQKPWPDFTQKDFINALCAYQERSRRFGGI